MIIQKIFAEEIFNAQGLATIQCTIQLENGITVKSSIPSGFTAPQAAISYAYDSHNRIVQQRMQQAIDYINTVIVPMMIKEPINALVMDSYLMDLHATQESASLGSNTTLVVSLTLFKAQAAAEGIQLFQLLQSISGTASIKIPMPLTSLFSLRHNNSLNVMQEFLAYSNDKSLSFEQQLHSLILLHHHTKKILDLKNNPTTSTMYGSFIPHITNIDELFETIQTIQQTLPHQSYNFGLNIGADDIFDASTETYTWLKKPLSSKNIISIYQDILNKYPDITYIQDAMASSDTQGWQMLTNVLNQNIYNAGDHVFGTNPMKIRWGIMKKICNVVAIKPEYISTISQTLAAIDACKNNKKLFIIIGDCLGTHDTFISDLAVATGATFLKAGAPSGSEHIAKYNRLLEIERFINSQT